MKVIWFWYTLSQLNLQIQKRLVHDLYPFPFAPFTTCYSTDVGRHETWSKDKDVNGNDDDD